MDANNIQRTDEQGATPAVMDIHDISPQQLAMLGVQQIAYVKPVVVNGTTAYAIHAADGTPGSFGVMRVRDRPREARPRRPLCPRHRLDAGDADGTVHRGLTRVAGRPSPS